jgi:hypothetical protein
MKWLDEFILLKGKITISVLQNVARKYTGLQQAVKFVNLNQISRKSFQKNIWQNKHFLVLKYEKYWKYTMKYNFYTKYNFYILRKRFRLTMHAFLYIFVGRVAFIAIPI